jgi:hypothetical protein
MSGIDAISQMLLLGFDFLGASVPGPVTAAMNLKYIA